jgi:hypothetical protein
MTAPSLFESTPRRAVVVFLSAVFCVFASFGFVNDVLDLGRQSPVRFAVQVVLTGLFAIGYAFAGISLRNKFLWGILPLFVVQYLSMAMVAHLLPDAPAAGREHSPWIASLASRMTFDGIGVIVAVSLGYTGFIYVFISEGRRYIRANAEKALLEGEMLAAREIQEVILPGAGESFRGYRVESVYRPASQVGGDFFQILSVGKSSLLIVVGDVAGKGLPAAMLVSMLVGSIRILADESHDPVLTLQRLNERLMGRTRGGFCTALVAFIADDGLVTIANAGHLPPYLDGQEVELPGAFPLGIVSEAPYEATQFHFQAGSRLTFYSDGVVEAMNSEGEIFGFERARALSSAPAQAIVEAAVKYGQSDDITVVTVERLAAA